MKRRALLAAGAFLVASAGARPAAADARPPRKIIFDDDGGFGLSAAMLLRAPDVQLMGLTVVTGDLWRDEAVAHALRGLEIAGRTDVPVVPGAVYPLLNTEARTDRWEALYGRLVWKGAWMRTWVEPTKQSPPRYHAPDVVPKLPEGDPTTRARAEVAAEFIIRTVRAHPGEVTIIAAGPFTNIALAVSLAPEIASLAAGLVYMGGSLDPVPTRDDLSAAQFAREFVNSPRREFNIRFDPEAASIVMHAGWKNIVMVPVDPSTATEITPELLHRLSQAHTPLAQWIARREPGFPMWDEIATAVWLDPSLITSSARLYVDVNTQFDAGYGDTLSWSPGYQPGLGEQLETVVRRIDVPRFEGLLTRLLGRG